MQRNLGSPFNLKVTNFQQSICSWLATRTYGEHAMSILASLTFSGSSKKGEARTPHLKARKGLVTAIDEQIAGATAEISGQAFFKTVEKVVKNKETGVAERRTVQRSLRRWWWTGTEGLMLELKCANRALKFGDMSSIVVGAKENLVPVLEKVREAVVAGELDEALKAVSEGRKRSGNQKKDGKQDGVASGKGDQPPTKPAKR